MPPRKVMQKYEQILESVLEMFQDEQVLTSTIEFAMLQPAEGDTRPCARWSFINKIFMIRASTLDARGYRQWQKVGRQVLKGAKAFYILAPLVKTKKEKKVCGESGKEEEIERTFINGFRFVPVFRLEDTEGDTLSLYDYSPPEPPPLYDVAMTLGINVQYTTGENCPGAAGFFQWGEKQKRIVLATHDVAVFFHELAHGAHHRTGRMEERSKEEKEAVAETVAAVLSRMYGYEEHNGRSWAYIKKYLNPDAKIALKQLFKLLEDIREVLELIFSLVEEEEIQKTA